MAQAPAKEDPWRSLRFMVGDWVGESDGEPGKGTVKRSYRFVLGNKFLHEQNVSTYPPQPKNQKGEVHEQPKKSRCSPSWARLIAKVFQADPLVCKRCGGPLKVVAYITDTVVIPRILDHLGLSPPETAPPDVREVVRVPVDDEGRERSGPTQPDN